MEVEHFLEEASAFERAQERFCIVGISGMNREHHSFRLRLVDGQHIDVSSGADRTEIFQALRALPMEGNTVRRPASGEPGPVPEQLDSHGMWKEVLHDFSGYLHLLGDYRPGLMVASISTDQQVALVRMDDGRTARDFEISLPGGERPFGIPLELAAEFSGSVSEGS